MGGSRNVQEYGWALQKQFLLGTMVMFSGKLCTDREREMSVGRYM